MGLKVYYELLGGEEENGLFSRFLSDNSPKNAFIFSILPKYSRNAINPVYSTVFSKTSGVNYEKKGSIMKLFSIFEERKDKMPEISTEKKNTIRILRSEEMPFDEISLKYALYEILIESMQPQYAMSVIKENEESFVSLGADRDFAVRVYSDMISGLVTPTSLRECTEDKIKAEYLYL